MPNNRPIIKLSEYEYIHEKGIGNMSFFKCHEILDLIVVIFVD